MMAPSSSSLHVPQRPTHPLQPRRPTHGFGVWRQRGRGFEYVRLRGSDISRGSLVISLSIYIWNFYVWYTIMHSLCVYIYALNYIYVIVISTWSWYMTCVLSTLNYLYVISLVLCSFAFASAFYSDANELYYLYSCIFHIFWVHHDGLGHISLSNTFVLIA